MENCEIVPIFKGKDDVMTCGSYREVKLQEHVMKIVKRVLERQIRTLVNLHKMQFGFMPGKETVNEIFIVRMKEEYQKDKKLHMCFVDMEKAFDRVPSDEVNHEKEGQSKVMVQAVMSL